MNIKNFYDKHKNFSFRTISEYLLSPGIRCKFDLIREMLGSRRNYTNSIDLGCSGNSFLYFLDNIAHKSFFDIASLPLKQYSKIVLINSKNGIKPEFWHPLCGDLSHLPYRNGAFDFISALDVLEHIKEDEYAITEISRILKKNGIAIITVPHRMKYYSNQDKLIGHYRRYETEQILSLFERYDLINIRIFGVYGKFMRIADIQSANPKKTEEFLLNLRTRFESDVIFRKFWNIIAKIGAKLMKIEAKYRSLKKIMNIAYMFIKK